jgi:hypothetical protein
MMMSIKDGDMDITPHIWLAKPLACKFRQFMPLISKNIMPKLRQSKPIQRKMKPIKI